MIYGRELYLIFLTVHQFFVQQKMLRILLGEKSLMGTFRFRTTNVYDFIYFKMGPLFYSIYLLKFKLDIPSVLNAN